MTLGAWEAYVAGVCRSLTAELDALRAVLELPLLPGSVGTRHSHHEDSFADPAAAAMLEAAHRERRVSAGQGAVHKLAAAIDTFGTELQKAWAAADVEVEMKEEQEEQPEVPEERIESLQIGHEKSSELKELLSADMMMTRTGSAVRPHESSWALLVKKLLVNHQADLEMWPHWTQLASSPPAPMSVSSKLVDKDALFRGHGVDLLSPSMQTTDCLSCHTCQVGFPTSRKRICWDLLSVLVLLYDLFTLPLTIFDYDDLDTVAYVRIATSVFWTVDIPCTFLVGFERRGIIERRFVVVARRYMQTWFVPDIFIVGSDWLLLLLGAPAGAASVGRVGKALRMMRVVRLLRVIRVAKLTKISDKLDSATTGALHAVFSIFKWLGCLVLICHTVGCCWYWVGTWLEDETRGWLVDVRERLEEDYGHEVSMMHRYAISFHWAISQFSPCSSPFNPRTLTEEIFNIIFIFCGLTIFSSFIGSVTTTITALRKGAMEVSRQHTVFHEYARYHRLTWDLQQNIAAYARYLHRRKPRILEKDVPFLHSLPEALLIQTRCQVCSTPLCKHPFFDYLLRNHALALMFTCHQAAAHEIYGTTDELFSFHAQASRMLFIVKGIAEYYEGPHGLKKGCSYDFRDGTWLCEASLWLRYLHLGRLIAKDETDVVCVDGAKFREVIVNRPGALTAAKLYGRSFSIRAIELSVDLDTWNDKSEVSDMLFVTIGALSGDQSQGFDSSSSQEDDTRIADFGVKVTVSSRNATTPRSFGLQ